ncbi:hypothetical protein [Dysgonomonas sp. 520]|uniref:hypothetical protein n=1 Tax=Dysgonomonas sp. 520 TaxID=2302931 RepID=UPI0013D38CA6|nr:hypothetical protein [Dysgonomonas sp. 520]NDW10131.1 hypothetical protein [Dysgonomonas sp. 520]
MVISEQELRIQLEEMKARSLSDGLWASDHKFIEQNYERVTFQRFAKRNCSRCYNDAFIEMYTVFKKNGLRDMPNFRLKNGAILQSAHFSEAVTNSNLTDEKAIQWLRDNPTRINFFAVYPENWETLLVDDGAAKKSKEKNNRKQK